MSWLGRLLDRMCGTNFPLIEHEPWMDTLNLDDWKIYLYAGSVKVEPGGYWDDACFVHTGSRFKYEMYRYEVTMLEQQGKLWPMLEQMRQASIAPVGWKTVETGHHDPGRPDRFVVPRRYL